MSEFRYPQYDLDQSIEVARRIVERGSGATVNTHELASFLGYSGANNGAYLNRLAAARLFGLIEGRAGAISATDRAEQIIHFDYPQTEERARLDAFRAVPLFAAFLDGFRGRVLPDEHGIINALVGRYKVSPKEAKAVAGRLRASAEQAGLFRVGGPDRMIEPTLAQTPDGPAASPDEPQPVSPSIFPDPAARRFPKIIDGALDLMPAAAPWDEAEYAEWLSFFDQACRVYYRIQRSGGKKPSE